MSTRYYLAVAYQKTPNILLVRLEKAMKNLTKDTVVKT